MDKVRRKVKNPKRPDWSLQPPPPTKANPRLMRPVLAPVPRQPLTKIIKQVSCQEPLRSKSSADMRPATLKETGSALQKPMSTSNLSSGRRLTSFRPPMAQLPIKAVLPKPIDASDKVNTNYISNKKKLGILVEKKGKPVRETLDADVNLALERALEIANQSTSTADNNAAMLLGIHAKKISSQLSSIDDWKAKYRALQDDVE